MKRNEQFGIPRTLRQLLRRLPFGGCTLYLNELSPPNQIFFLNQCFGARNETHDAAGGKLEPPLRGLRITHQEFIRQFPSGTTARRVVDEQESTVEGAHESSVVPDYAGATLSLVMPPSSRGHLEAYRSLHTNILPKQHIFLLVVPERFFNAAGASVSTEVVLQRHLMDVKRTLHWGEAPTLREASFERRIAEHEMGAATSGDGVLLVKIHGCTIEQAREAAKIAAARKCRLFLLSYGRQRLLCTRGPTLQELGYWCPNAFRSFQLDVRCTAAAPDSSLSSARSLLEEASRGFLQLCNSDNMGPGVGGISHSTDNAPSKPNFISYAVAEVAALHRHAAPTTWSCTADCDLTARLFEALFDERHYCTMDAVLHASKHVVLPFLTGELSTGRLSDASQVTMPRLLRWSEIHSTLRWRYFEPLFGSLSQVVRAEDVFCIGGGRDPVVLPLHRAFVTRTLLPLMRKYQSSLPSTTHQSSKRDNKSRSRNGRGRPKGSTRGSITRSRVKNATVTLNTLDCFNHLVREVMLRDVDPASRKVKHSEGDAQKTLGDSPCFGLQDLPMLVKYLLYFSEFFRVSSCLTTFTFDLSD
ncbi:hypothetical protein TRVL_00022 [Trypanosoma vivax]|nr:hypothetical protein TRVL_00022 [Trypanosoma vivax]